MRIRLRGGPLDGISAHVSDPPPRTICAEVPGEAMVTSAWPVPEVSERCEPKTVRYHLHAAGSLEYREWLYVIEGGL